jgi:HEAT repeat protein
MGRGQLRVVGPVFVAALLAVEAASEASKQAGEVLADFQRAWKPLTGREYMRPLDDTGWKARMEAFHRFAGAADKALPSLTDALLKGNDDTRVFAAQALALLPDSAAKVSLVKALKDKHPAVRLYALDALSMFGKLPGEELYQTLRQKDGNGDVRAHAAFAMERDDKPQPDAVRQTLGNYDLKKMAPARVGEKAPDFTLTSAAGKAVRLSAFRDKMRVILVFVYGDT